MSLIKLTKAIVIGLDGIGWGLTVDNSSFGTVGMQTMVAMVTSLNVLIKNPTSQL